MSTKFYPKQRDYIAKLNEMDDDFQNAIGAVGMVANNASTAELAKNAAAAAAVTAADKAAVAAAEELLAEGHKNASATNAANAAAANLAAQAEANKAASSQAQAKVSEERTLQAWAAAAYPNEALAAITRNIHFGTVVDHCIYDTTKDTDGGMWRLQQGKSYQNETLSGTWLGQKANELAARGDNLLAYPEPTVAQLSSSTNVADASLPISGYATSIQVGDNSAQRVAYRGATGLVNGTIYAFSIVVQMDDGSAPVVGPTAAGNDFQFIAAGQTPNNQTVAAVPGKLGQYLVYGTVSYAGVNNWGLVKNTGHSAKSFRVTAFKVNAISYDANKGNPEQIPNGGFDAGLANWADHANGGGSASVANGMLTLTGTLTNTLQGKTITFPTTSGKTYVVRCRLASASASSGRYFRIPGLAPNTDNANFVVGDNYASFVATGSTATVQLLVFNTTDTIVVDEVSCKEVTVFATPYVSYAELANRYYQNTTDGKFYSLNTTYGQTEVTRGNKRNHPANAYYVAEAGRIVVYDLDTPDHPMWMVFTGVANSYLYNSGSLISAIDVRNGEMFFTKSTTYGLTRVNFISESGTLYQASSIWKHLGNIAGRNGGNPISQVSTGAYLQSSLAYDVAVTVLPDAPINPNTGLAEPTVAVMTQGGVSVIKHDGTVASHAFSFTGVAYDNVTIKDDMLFYGNSSNVNGFRAISLNGLPSSFVGTQFGNATSMPWAGGLNVAISKSLIATDIATVTNGLALSKINPASPLSSMRAVMTTAYNTGWQVGDARLTALCDTNPEVLTASGELVGNGIFSQDFLGWNIGPGVKTSVDDGVVTATTAGHSNVVVSQTIPTVVGRQYTASLTRVAGGLATSVYVDSQGGMIPFSASAGEATGTFTATGSTTIISIVAPSSNNTVKFSAISVKEKSGGELITNGKFAQDTTGWTITGDATNVSIASGWLSLAANGGTVLISTPVTTVVGREYTLSFDTGNGNTTAVHVGTTLNGVQTLPLTGVVGAIVGNKFKFTATATTHYITFQRGNASAVLIDNVSVKETAGVELVSNGKFDTDTTGWNNSSSGATLTVNGSGQLVVTGNGTTAYPMARVDLSNLTVGKQYQVTFDMLAGSGVVIANHVIKPSTLSSGDMSYYYPATPGTYTVTFVAVSTNVSVRLVAGAAANAVGIFDNVSVRDTGNLVLNGAFDVDTSNWTASNNGTLSVASGALRITSAAGFNGTALQDFPTTVGRTYEVTLTRVGGTGAGRMYVGTTATYNLYGDTSASTLTFVASASSCRLTLGVGSGTSGHYYDFDNVSVKDVTELVTNGQFEGLTTGWSSSTSYPSMANCVNGEIQVTASVGFGRQVTSFPTVVGKSYLVTGTLRAVSGGTAYIAQCSSSGGDILQIGGSNASTTPTTVTGIFTATATTSYLALALNNVAGAVGAFDNISVVETGNLLTNGEFNFDISGWANSSTGTGTFVRNGGVAELTGVDTNNRGRMSQSIAVVQGRAYQLSFDKVSGAGINTQVTGGGGITFDKFPLSATGNYVYNFTARATGALDVTFNCYGAGTVGIDNVSVKDVTELLVNNTFQNRLQGWTSIQGAVLSVANGILRVTSNGTQYGTAQTSITTVPGKQYTVNATKGANVGGAAQVQIGTSGDVTLPAYRDLGSNITTLPYTFTATATTTYINLQCGNASGDYSEWDNVSVREEAGVNLVTNGGFDTDTGWTKNTGWAISSGVATFSGATGATLVQQLILAVGKQYQITFDLTVTSGTLSVYAGSTGSTGFTTSGTKTVIITSSGTGLAFSALTGFAGSIDNVSVRETGNLVLNGTFDADTSNWTASSSFDCTAAVVGGEMQVTANVTSGRMMQTVNLTAGRTYSLTATMRNVTNASSATVGVGTTTNGSVAGAALILSSGSTSNVTHSGTFVAPQNTMYLYAGVVAGAAGHVTAFDNIVIKDVTELVSNGTFEGSLAGWEVLTSGVEVLNGKLRLTNPASGSINAGVRQAVAVVPGRTYVLTGDVTNISGGAVVQAGINGASGKYGALTGVIKSITFSPVESSIYIYCNMNATTAGNSADIDNISLKLADPDRSVKGLGGIVYGNITKEAVAPGASLMCYRGFSTQAGIEFPYTNQLDFGTGDFAFYGWLNRTALSTFQSLFDRKAFGVANNRVVAEINGTNGLNFTTVGSGGNAVTVSSPTDSLNQTARWYFIVLTRVAGKLSIYIDGAQSANATGTVQDLTNTSAVLNLGTQNGYASPATATRYAEFRFSATVPSDDQIKYMYETERKMFEPGAKNTIDGTTNAVTSMAFDEDTGILHLGSSWGRSGFVDLVRVESEATTVGAVNAIAAGNGTVIMGGTSAKIYQPAIYLRDELRRRTEARKALGKEPRFFEFEATTGQTAFVLPKGWTVKAVYSDGVLKREGATKHYTRSFDGFVETVNFGVAPGNAVWVSIMAVRT